MTRLSTLAFVMVAALVVGAAIAEAAKATDVDYLHPVKDAAKVKAAIQKALLNQDPLPRHAGIPFRLAHVKKSSGRRLHGDTPCSSNSCNCPPPLVVGVSTTQCECQLICSASFPKNVFGLKSPFCTCYPTYN